MPVHEIQIKTARGSSVVLTHCATSRNVAGSIPDGVIGIFHWHNPSGRTMVLGLTYPLTEMSTGNVSLGVNAAGALGWQLYGLHVPIVVKSGKLNLLEPSGSVMGLLYLYVYPIKTHSHRCYG